VRSLYYVFNDKNGSWHIETKDIFHSDCSSYIRGECSSVRKVAVKYLASCFPPDLPIESLYILGNERLSILFMDALKGLKINEIHFGHIERIGTNFFETLAIGLSEFKFKISSLRFFECDFFFDKGGKLMLDDDILVSSLEFGYACSFSRPETIIPALPLFPHVGILEFNLDNFLDFAESHPGALRGQSARLRLVVGPDNTLEEAYGATEVLLNNEQDSIEIAFEGEVDPVIIGFFYVRRTQFKIINAELWPVIYPFLRSRSMRHLDAHIFHGLALEVCKGELYHFMILQIEQKKRQVQALPFGPGREVIILKLPIFVLAQCVGAHLNYLKRNLLELMMLGLGRGSVVIQDCLGMDITSQAFLNNACYDMYVEVNAVKSPKHKNAIRKFILDRCAVLIERDAVWSLDLLAKHLANLCASKFKFKEKDVLTREKTIKLLKALIRAWEKTDSLMLAMRIVRFIGSIGSWAQYATGVPKSEVDYQRMFLTQFVQTVYDVEPEFISQFSRRLSDGCHHVEINGLTISIEAARKPAEDFSGGDAKRRKFNTPEDDLTAPVSAPAVFTMPYPKVEKAGGYLMEIGPGI
jgi:hypothetical protein